MISDLLFVFLIQVLLHLVNTVGKQPINDALWLLFTKLPLSASRDAGSLDALRSDVVRLHREMTATSAQDEFAKWAKLRRQHDKAKELYDERARAQQSLHSTFDRAATAVRFLGVQAIAFALNTYHAKTPMFWLPRGWVPHAAEWILSFPRAPLGSISVNAWAMTCAGVVKLVGEAVGAVWVLMVVGKASGKEKEKVGVKMEGRGGGLSSGTGSGREKKEL